MIVEYEEIRLNLAAMEKPIGELEVALNIEGAINTIKELEKEMVELKEKQGEAAEAAKMANILECERNRSARVQPVVDAIIAANK